MRLYKRTTFSIILIGLFVSHGAMAATTNVNWTVAGTGAWETAGNWSPALVPSITNESNASIFNGGTAEITQVGQTAKLITLAFGSTATGNVHLISGTLETSADQNLCRGGVAQFTQESGTTNKCGGPLTVGEQSGSRGIYMLNGGVLTVPSSDMIIGYLSGANGSVEQSGGVLGNIGSSKYLYLGRSSGAVGTYLMNGGSILFTNNNYVSIGNFGVGHFTQNNGTVGVDQHFNIGKENGGYGEYTLNNGSFFAYWPVVGEQNGSTGVVTITGGSFQGGRWFSVGQSGCGTVLQSGGTVGVTNEYLILGEASSGVGTYVLSGTGKVMLTNAANYLYVGYNGNGTFIQSNGVVAVTNYLIVGKYANSVGRYRISNGSLTVGQNLVIGEAASATGSLQVVGSAAIINVKAYQQNTNSTLDVQLDTGGLSPINVANNASLNGEIKITGTVEELDYNTVVTVINAGSITGTFSRTNLVPPLVRADIIYDVINGDVKLTHFRYPEKGMRVSIE